MTKSIAMPRTNQDRVKAILAPGGDYNLRTNPSLTSFITIANLTVNAAVALGLERNKPIADDVALEMEGWVAAHAYCQSDKQYVSRSTGGSSGSFITGILGDGLKSTTYGRTALMLDFNGLLADVTSNEQSAVILGGDYLGIFEKYVQTEQA